MYLLLNENISSLRKSNIFITLNLGLIINYAIFTFNDTFKNLNIKDKFFKFLFLLPTSIGVIYSISEIRILTPSYNSTNFYGFCIIVFTIIFITYKKNYRRFTAILIILGINLIIFSKPSSAAILAPILFLYSLNLCQKDKRVLINSLISGFILSGVLIISKSNWSIENSLFKINQAINLKTFYSSSYKVDGFINFISNIFNQNYNFNFLIIFCALNFLIFFRHKNHILKLILKVVYLMITTFILILILNDNQHNYLSGDSYIYNDYWYTDYFSFSHSQLLCC